MQATNASVVDTDRCYRLLGGAEEEGVEEMLSLLCSHTTCAMARGAACRLSVVLKGVLRVNMHAETRHSRSSTETDAGTITSTGSCEKTPCAGNICKTHHCHAFAFNSTYPTKYSSLRNSAAVTSNPEVKAWLSGGLSMQCRVRG